MQTQRLLTQTRIHLERQTDAYGKPRLYIVTRGVHLEVCLGSIEQSDDQFASWEVALLANVMRELSTLDNLPDTIGGMLDLFNEAVACVDMCVMLVDRAAKGDA